MTVKTIKRSGTRIKRRIRSDRDYPAPRLAGGADPLGRFPNLVLPDGMIKRLLHTRYRVSDLEKTISFYTDVLGLEMTRRSTSPRGSELVFFKAPGSVEEIEICKFDGSGPVKVGPDLTHLAFEVADIAAFARHSTALGYPLSDGPTKTAGGSIIGFLDAPEGYEIELIQPG